jgi:hypothetical protein
MRKQIGQFKAKHADGTTETVFVFQDFHKATTLAEGSHDVPGMKSLLTADGRRVNRTGEGQYQIVGVPMIPLTSDDPNAV